MLGSLLPEAFGISSGIEPEALSKD